MGQAILPAIMVGTSLLGSFMSNREQSNAAAEAQARQEAMYGQQMQHWQQNAYPNQAAIAAREKEGKAGIAESKAGAYQNMAQEMARRGFGPGSGLFGKEAQGIERGAIKSIGQLQTDLTKFAGTPQWSPPYASGGVNYTPITSEWGGVGQDASDLAGTYLGYSLMRSMLGGGSGSGGALGRGVLNPYG